MCYHEEIDNYITTKFAFDSKFMIVKANIFLKPELDVKAYFGFHAYPDRSTCEVTKTLSMAAIATAHTKEINDIYIRTNQENCQHIAVANRLGFEREARYEVKGLIVFRLSK